MRQGPVRLVITLVLMLASTSCSQPESAERVMTPSARPDDIKGIPGYGNVEGSLGGNSDGCVTFTPTGGAAVPVIAPFESTLVDNGQSLRLEGGETIELGEKVELYGSLKESWRGTPKFRAQHWDDCVPRNTDPADVFILVSGV